MSTLIAIDRQEREAIRLRFFRTYRDRNWFSSVSVRRDGDSWRLSVGVVGANNDLPSEFEGLRVEAYETASAVHAVAYPAE